MEMKENPVVVTPPDAALQERTIDTITGEILELKKTAGQAVLDIGRRLIEAKAKLTEGEWLTWLAEQVDFSPRTAQRFMRLAREWTDATTLSYLGASKALVLLALPPFDRDEFISQVHEVNGAEKAVSDMSARELAQAVKERDIARKEAEIAKKDLSTAESSLEKLSADLKLANECLARAKEDKTKADKAVSDLESELVQLKSAPVEVAVMEPDPDAIEKATAELRAELTQAIDAKKQAEKMQQDAESLIEDLKRQLEETSKSKGKAAALADPDVAKFEVYFNDSQDSVNKMRGLLLKVRAREDQSTAKKLSQAILALAERVREAAG